MNDIYVLHHVRPEDDVYEESVKLIGLYSTKEAAEGAARRLVKRPGFCGFPEGFEVSAYEVDKDHWESGFVLSSTE